MAFLSTNSIISLCFTCLILILTIVLLVGTAVYQSLFCIDTIKNDNCWQVVRKFWWAVGLEVLVLLTLCGSIFLSRRHRVSPYRLLMSIFLALSAAYLIYIAGLWNDVMDVARAGRNGRLPLTQHIPHSWSVASLRNNKSIIGVALMCTIVAALLAALHLILLCVLGCQREDCVVNEVHQHTSHEVYQSPCRQVCPPEPIIQTAQCGPCQPSVNGYPPANVSYGIQQNYPPQNHVYA